MEGFNCIAYRDDCPNVQGDCHDCFIRDAASKNCLMEIGISKLHLFSQFIEILKGFKFSEQSRLHKEHKVNLDWV